MGPLEISVVIGLILLAIINIRKRIICQWRIEASASHFILVTAADDWIGRHLVQNLDKLGFSVIAGCDTRIGLDKLQRTSSENVIPFLYDIRDYKSVDSLVSFVGRMLPRDSSLFGLVHCYNVPGTPAMFEWTNQEDMQTIMTLNLFSAMEITKALLPWLRKSKGRIIIASAPTELIGFPSNIENHISKTGIDVFCSCLRRELYKTEVSVHTVTYQPFNPLLRSPEITKTRIRQLFDNNIPAVTGHYGDRFVQFLTAQTHERKMPDVEEIVTAYILALTQRLPSNNYHVYRKPWRSWLPLRLQEYLCQRVVPLPEDLDTVTDVTDFMKEMKS